jgi:glycerol uptake facilitator protein
MSPFLGEFIGTMLLIIMGDGVVANVVLNKTKGNNSGWIVITFGWAMAVFLGVYVSTSLGEWSFNPAVTIAMTAFYQILMHRFCLLISVLNLPAQSQGYYCLACLQTTF